MVGTEKTADYKSAGTWKSADCKSAETTVDLPRQNEKWCSSRFIILTTYCSGGFVIRRRNRQITNLPRQHNYWTKQLAVPSDL